MQPRPSHRRLVMEAPQLAWQLFLLYLERGDPSRIAPDRGVDATTVNAHVSGGRILPPYALARPKHRAGMDRPQRGRGG